MTEKTRQLETAPLGMERTLGAESESDTVHKTALGRRENTGHEHESFVGVGRPQKHESAKPGENAHRRCKARIVNITRLGTRNRLRAVAHDDEDGRHPKARKNTTEIESTREHKRTGQKGQGGDNGHEDEICEKRPREQEHIPKADEHKNR